MPDFVGDLVVTKVGLHEHELLRDVLELFHHRFLSLTGLDGLLSKGEVLFSFVPRVCLGFGI